MSAAQWSTRQTNGGFSVSFFWLSSTKGGTGQNKLRNRKRRHKRDRQKSTKPTLLPSATVEHDTHPAPVKQSSAEGSRAPTPINARQSAHARSPSPPNLLAATVPHSESQQSQGSDNSETSSPVKPISQDNDWTLVSPRRRRQQRPRSSIPPPPYFRMPFHLRPLSIQERYPQATSSEDSEESPVASRTRARTTRTELAGCVTLGTR